MCLGVWGLGGGVGGGGEWGRGDWKVPTVDAARDWNEMFLSEGDGAGDKHGGYSEGMPHVLTFLHHCMASV